MKKNIALIAGGYSREYEISMLSAATVEENLDSNLYDVYKIIIKRHKWYYDYDGGEAEVDRNDFSIELSGEKVYFDAAIIMLHGSPGEDGLLQAYFDISGIPYSTCGVALSALTFNKELCNKLINAFGVLTPPSLSYHINDTPDLSHIISTLGLPLFVKPAEGGSSFGISKVNTETELKPAIEKAFSEDKNCLIETYIPGIEITCGVFEYKGSLHVFPPTEIVPHTEYFDFDAKYLGKSDEITPARIPEELLLRCQSTSAMIYKRLKCFGVVRIDYILSDNDFYFLEINTVPGMSGPSIVPQQIVEYGWTPREFYNMIVENTLCKVYK